MKSFRKLNHRQSALCDGFRYFAALAVALHHVLAYFYVSDYRAISQKAFYTNLGSIGVTIFFFLSGFLICYTIQRKRVFGSYSFSVYAVERFVRIYLVFAPAFALALFFNLLNSSFIKDNVPGANFLSLKYILSTFFMLSGVKNVTGHQEIFPFFGPAWTINYEFFAYFVFGALTLSIYKFRHAWDWLIRFLTVSFFGFLALKLPDTSLLLNWSLGVVLAFAFQKVKSCQIIGYGLMLLGVALCFSSTLSLGSETVRLLFGLGISLFFLGSLFVAEDLGPIKQSFSELIIAKLAGFSYSLYLTHVPILWLYRHMCLKFNLYTYNVNDYNKLICFFGAIFAVNLIAFLFSRFTEAHTQEMRNWFLSALKIRPTRTV